MGTGSSVVQKGKSLDDLDNEESLPESLRPPKSMPVYRRDGKVVQLIQFLHVIYC